MPNIDSYISQGEKKNGEKRIIGLSEILVIYTFFFLQNILHFLYLEIFFQKQKKIQNFLFSLSE